MKTSLQISITLSSLLFAFTTFLFAFTTYLNLPLASTQDTEQVVDTNGNPIFPGGRFYIMPSIFGAAGGGVRLSEETENSTTTTTTTCPVTVLQDYSEVVNGLPVKFSIPEMSPGIIFTETTPLNIAFEDQNKPECAESSKWVIVSDDDFNREYVGIGGVGDSSGKEILSGKFRIEKHGFGYKLVFCPRFTAAPGVCVDIGSYNDENGRRLVLTNEDPFEVVFVDADVITGISSIV